MIWVIAYGLVVVLFFGLMFRWAKEFRRTREEVEFLRCDRDALAKYAAELEKKVPFNEH